MQMGSRSLKSSSLPSLLHQERYRPLELQLLLFSARSLVISAGLQSPHRLFGTHAFDIELGILVSLRTSWVE
jgi:hypothetical protein